MVGAAEYSALVGSELRLSRVGFGCWAVGGHGYGVVDDGESISAIQQALSSGINFFDTADIYGFGHSEEVLSKGLGARRHDVVIATKFGVCWDATGKTYRDSSARRVVEALEGSLRRLRVDCIPLYQLHQHDGVTPLEETMEALCRCREKGKVRFIGCTNLSAVQMASMNAIARLSSIQLQFSLANRSHERLLQDCEAEGMSTIVYGALVRGLLSGKYDRHAAFGRNDTRSTDADFRGPQFERGLEIVRELASAAERYDKSPAQVALRWVLDSQFISSVIVGMKTRDQVVGNIGAMGWSLTIEDWQRLSRSYPVTSNV
jgi:aryl-alcohol dehydrogenase-like predicted oxidoreductase